jgi:hypothetical protein
MDDNRLKELLGYGRDFAQGASNSAASNISGPVDGIAWLLRRAGINVPEAPIGSSEWMMMNGLTPRPNNRLAGMLGESAGVAGPAMLLNRSQMLAKGLLDHGK